MCFMMDPSNMKKICYVQFPQRFDGIDTNDRYANHNSFSMMLVVWLSDWGYSDWFQDACSRMEINILYASPYCIQRICTYQSFRLFKSGVPLGHWLY
ncbi:hypothetical protein HHK36_020980 [Tetracentron sinense]|uniref:Uncharacterized protein n=1 Tax=Tetracentron sinense TaxID=13715 RepID=A0A834YW49_TETSI|nr:hypothetical protein HHK36_020980 [Tetracentron sinense]